MEQLGGIQENKEKTFKDSLNNILKSRPSTEVFLDTKNMSCPKSMNEIIERVKKSFIFFKFYYIVILVLINVISVIIQRSLVFSMAFNGIGIYIIMSEPRMQFLGEKLSEKFNKEVKVTRKNVISVLVFIQLLLFLIFKDIRRSYINLFAINLLGLLVVVVHASLYNVDVVGNELDT